MRLFFGVPIPESGRNELNTIISALNSEYDGHYTLLSNLHITLTFLGDIGEKVPYMLANIGDLAFNGLSKFSIETCDIHSFKDGKITYLGVKHNDMLTSIHKRLNTLLDECGMVYTDNETYTPHITLRRGAKKILDREVAPIRMDIDKICLYESLRVDDVLRYIPLKTWELTR